MGPRDPEAIFKYRVDPEGIPCTKCRDPVPATDFYIYMGKPYHKRCLPKSARDVATEAK